MTSEGTPAAGGGHPDPDSRARTHLANERTFLAWFRTGLALVALGLVCAQFLSINDVAGIPVVPILSTIVVVTGMALVAVGMIRYRHNRLEIDSASFLPADRSILLTGLAALVAGVLAVAFVWLLAAGK